MFAAVTKVSPSATSTSFDAPLDFSYFNPEVFLILFILLLIIIIPPIVWYYFWKKRVTWKNSFKLVLLRVAIPLSGPSNSNQNEKASSSEMVREKISVMEQLFASLSSIRPQNFSQRIANFPYFTLEIAVPFHQEGIAFYVAVPRDKVNIASKLIHSYFPLVTVEEVPNYNIFTPKGNVSACSIKLKKDDFLPIKTYRDLESDPLNGITNSLTKLDPKKEGAAIQIVALPIGENKDYKGKKIAREIKQGNTFEQAKNKVGNPLALMFKDLFSGFSSSTQENKNKLSSEKESHILTPSEERLIESLENKANKNNFKVNLRLISCASTKEKSDEILSQLKSAFTQFEGGNKNSFEFLLFGKLKNFIYDFTFRMFRPKQSFVLCTEELSSLYHFGIDILKAAPRIVSANSKKAPCPSNMPKTGLVLGKNVFREEETKVSIEREDRRRHFYCIGQTGTGKSTFLSEMIRQDIQSGEGLCVIDPHGELIEKVLTYVPKNRVEDVILFDPSDVEMPLGLNLLEYNRPEQKTFVINEMINIFDKLYDMRQTGGPMFEQYMRNAMLLVMAHPESGSTLLEISRVLSDPEFRKFKIEHCPDRVVVDFWQKEAEKAGGEAALANMVPYITSKLTSFIANDIMRPLIAQQKSAFNLREVMDEGKIVLMNLSKGSIGELNAYLLGMVMVGKILMAAMSRVDIQEEKRKDFYLYIDEFHNFTTDSIVSILSEARKYRLSLVIAHQFIKQLSEKIRDAVFGNVGSLAAFRVGPEDSEFLSKQFEPVFSSYDLMNLDNYNAYLKLMMRGQVSTPFSIGTFPPAESDDPIVDVIKKYSRERYGRPRKEIEEEIFARLENTKGNKASSIPIDSDMGIK